MPLKDDSWLDPSRRATERLNEALGTDASTLEDVVILDEKLVEQEKKKEDAPVAHEEGAAVESLPETVTVDEARNEEPVVEVVSSRTQSRLLIITKDVTVMQEGSPTYKRIVDESGHFLEIHVIVMNYADGETKIPITRLTANAWLYPTNSSSWWTLAFDAYRMARAQLIFGGGFRADIIVAEDPFEAGLVARYLAKKYERPFQVHIYEDFFDDTFIASQKYPALYEWFTHHLIEDATSVRTKTEFQRRAIIEERKDLEQYTELLPSYYSLDAWDAFQPTCNLHEKYPQFRFIILHVSTMQKGSHTEDVLIGASKILKRYPTIGLVIVGSGPLRSALEKTTISLGLQQQVEFEPMPVELMSYMKTANVFVHLSEDGAEDELILMAATAKLPLIAHKDGLAGKLFVDGESACLCATGDVDCVADSINRYLNENHDRANFALNAHATVFERIEQDYGAYLKAYAESIERCVAGAS